MASRFPTSVEIFNRLKTDPAFRASLGQVTYHDNIKKKYVDVPVLHFVPISSGGDIPWHRVWYLKYNGEVVWDRREKTCIMDKIASQQSSFVHLPHSFTVLTLNVMNRKYESSEKRRDDSRKNQLVQYLLDSNADVICLQEVWPELMAEFQADPFAEVYPYSATTSMPDDNIVFLSKLTIVSSLPIEVEAKQALTITLRDEDYHSDWHFIGVHLTSTLRSHSEIKRREQLRKVLDNVQASTSTWKEGAIILGDFNGEVQFKLPEELTTIEETYVTYDPTKNPHAQLMSNSNLTLCLDRVLYTKASLQLCSHSVDASCMESDHFPLLLNFNIQELEYRYDDPCQTIATTTASCLVIIVPPAEWPVINAIREQGDPAFERWMPHITLCPKFLIGDQLEEFVEAIHSMSLEPFEIKLGKINFFEHAKSQTFYLEPCELSRVKLKAVHDQISKQFSVIFDANEEYIPHVTLSASPPPKASFDLNFTVYQLYVVEKSAGTNFFQVKHIIPFNRRPEIVNPKPCDIVNTLRYFQSGNSDSPSWDIGGSAVFSDDLTCSDLDIVISGDMELNEFYSTFNKYVRTCGNFINTEQITNPHGTYLKTNYKGMLEVDIHFVDRANPSEHALSVRDESVNILEAMTRDGLREVFLAGLSAVKKGARECQVYGSSHGFLPGISWAILTAHFCQNRKPSFDTAEKFMQNFAEYFSQYDWTIPVKLSGQSSYKPQPLKNFCDNLAMIITTTHPRQNTARTLTKSTMEVLKTIFESNLNKDAEPAPAHLVTLTITAHVVQQESLYGCRNMLRSLLPVVLIKFEKKIGNCRPFCVGEIQKVLDLQLRFSWSMGFRDDSSIIQHYYSLLIQKLQANFPTLSIQMEQM